MDPRHQTHFFIPINEEAPAPATAQGALETNKDILQDLISEIEKNITFLNAKAKKVRFQSAGIYTIAAVLFLAYLLSILLILLDMRNQPAVVRCGIDGGLFETCKSSKEYNSTYVHEASLLVPLLLFGWIPSALTLLCAKACLETPNLSNKEWRSVIETLQTTVIEPIRELESIDVQPFLRGAVSNFTELKREVSQIRNHQEFNKNL